MKVKLIQAGGFTGKHKVAEADLSQHPQVKEHLEEMFSGPVRAGSTASPARDKEQLFLEYDGKTMPVNSLTPNSQLKDLIDKMRSDLKFEK